MRTDRPEPGLLGQAARRGAARAQKLPARGVGQAAGKGLASRDDRRAKKQLRKAAKR